MSHDAQEHLHFCTAPLMMEVLEALKPPQVSADAAFVTAPVQLLPANAAPPARRIPHPRAQDTTTNKSDTSAEEFMMDAMEVEPMEVMVGSTSEFGEVPSAEAKVIMSMISLRTPYFQPVDRAPIDIVAVVDRSGSMGGSKLMLTRDTLKFLAGQLSGTDRLGIVCYDDNVTTPLPLSAMDNQGKSRALDVIDKIMDGGSTNLSGGLCQGIQEITHQERRNDVSSVLLLTDGLPNVGKTTSMEIIQEMRIAITRGPDPLQLPGRGDSMSSTASSSLSDLSWKMASATFSQLSSHESSLTSSEQSYFSGNAQPSSTCGLPCTVNTFGYGSDHNPILLRSIAEAGNGVYYFVKTHEEIPTLFADCLGGLLSVCAQNISIQIEPLNGAQIKKVYGRYNVVPLNNGNAFEITIGDIQSEEEKDILFSLELPILPNAHPEDMEFARISFKYFNVISGQIQSGRVPVCVKRPAQLSRPQRLNYSVDLQRNRILAAEAMDLASNLANTAHNLSEARNTIINCINKIKSSASASDNFCVNLVKDLQDTLEGMQDLTSWGSSGNMIVQAQVSSINNQRSTGVSSVSLTSFTTSSRKTAVTGYLSSLN